MASADLVFEVEKASFGYRHPVLHGVDLTIAAGERVAVIGRNGAGKSTLLRGLIGLVPAQGGRVALAGADVSSLERGEVARRVAYLPQDVRPAAGLLALDVVLLGRAAHRPAGPAAWVFDTDEEVAAARSALEEVGAAGLGGRPFRELSGGERRLVLLAQALAQAGDAILLDEPTAALDLRAQWLVAERLVAVAERRKLALVLVTHDITLAARVCGRLLLIAAAQLGAALDQPSVVLADGRPDAVLVPELLGRAFGVDVEVFRREGVAGPLVVPRGIL